MLLCFPTPGFYAWGSDLHSAIQLVKDIDLKIRWLQEVGSFSNVIKLSPLPDSSMPTDMISDSVSMSVRDLELCYNPLCPYLQTLVSYP